MKTGKILGGRKGVG